ncbi:FAD/NAD(P)-binding protein [Streptomyces roseifaciens]
MTTASPAPLRLAFVGGGPSCTYTMERLAAMVSAHDGPLALDIHVFDRTGRFGDGEVHSAEQPSVSFLNRIVGQVAFAADETVTGAGPLLAPAERPTLLEWCRRKFEETGDPAFDLAAEDWPKRYVHGLALKDLFTRYRNMLEAHPGVTVHLRRAEVTDVVDEGTHLRLVSDGAEPLDVDHVLMVTGHSTNDPARTPRQRPWQNFAERSAARFIPSAYPLERHLSEDDVAPEETVGCVGMGLTTFDVILYLTEGRGGQFVPADGGGLDYVPSGREPRSIVCFSGSGLFTFARPYNAKEVDLATYEHRGRFLTEDAVDRLRKTVGVPVTVGTREQRQLDFERHVFPLVVLEMHHLYYKTLLGADVADELARVSEAAYASFLDGESAGLGTEEATEILVAPLRTAVTAMETVLDGLLSGTADAPAEDLPWSVTGALYRFLTVVFGPEQAERMTALAAAPAELAAAVAGESSPWRHAKRVADHRFSWHESIRPIPATEWTSPEAYRAAMVAFMEKDHLQAAQDNLTNPAKAAADGVWRDLRPVLGHAVDFGGLTPSSHRAFLDVFMRHHNRLANGAALEVMEKMLALIRCGLVDIDAGPDARVRGEGDQWHVTGPHTGAERSFDVLVEAKVHAFDPAADTAPLYPNLLRRGLVRKWSNPGDGTEPPFEPGGLDLDAAFHPLAADGTADRRLTFLGPPSEGVMFFQLGALRPQQDHHVMQDILTWLAPFWEHVLERSAAARPAGTAAPSA